MSIVGQRFAFRKRARILGELVQPVEVLKEGPPRLQKVRIRYLDGEYEGLEEWVPKTRLLVPWKDVESFCEDERRLLAACEASEAVYGTIPYDAAGWVFAAIAELFNEELVLTGWKTVERDLVIIHDFDKAVQKLDLDRESLLVAHCAFIDRYGDYKAPFPIGEKFAKIFCQRYPKQVLRYIKMKEAQWRKEVLEKADPFSQRVTDSFHDRYEMAFSLIREWCGEEESQEINHIDALRDEVRELRNMIKSTAEWLKGAGHNVKAAMLLKQLNERNPYDK